MQTYDVEEVSLGDVNKADKIVFLSVEEMDKAYTDIDNGNDIYVKDKMGLIIRIKNSMIKTKINNGTILMAARGGQKC